VKGASFGPGIWGRGVGEEGPEEDMILRMETVTMQVRQTITEVQSARDRNRVFEKHVVGGAVGCFIKVTKLKR
jgi:hypothetical protein